MGLPPKLVNEKSVPYGTVMTQPVLAGQSRRETRRESRRCAILDIAAQSFMEHGYAGTTMSAIAAMLGGSKATLWSYFASKELLFGAVLERRTAAFRAQLSLILDPEGDVEAVLDRFCREFLTKVASSEAIALNRLVLGEVNRFPEIGRIFYERGPRLVQLLLSEFLARAMADGKLRDVDPFQAAQMLTSLCMSGSHQQLLLGELEFLSRERAAADAERALRTFLRAFVP